MILGVTRWLHDETLDRRCTSMQTFVLRRRESHNATLQVHACVGASGCMSTLLTVCTG